MRFETSIHIDAPADSVWDLCADPIAVSRLCGEDLTIRPAEAADQDTGAAPEVGARYRSLIRIGAAIVGGDIMIVHYTRARELAWNSITGIEHRVRLRLRPDGGGTRVTLRFSYDVPGLFGTAVDFAAYPRLRGMLRGALEELARQAEHGQDSAAPQRTFLGSTFAARIVNEAGNIAALRHSGLISPMRPDRLARMALAVNTWGLTLGAAVAAGSVRYGDQAAVDDEFGTVSYTELDRATDAIAVGLVEAGVRDGDAIAVMTRNHRGFLQAVAAAAKAGCDVVPLNTGFSGPQVAQVCRAEQPTAVIADSEFDDAVADAASGRLLVRADPDAGLTPDGLTPDGLTPDGLTLRGLAARHDGQRPPAPEHVGEVVILTSGTTGSPKGARRGAGGSGGSPSLEAPAALLERIPLHAGDRVALARPGYPAYRN
ncbi:MAG: AMP-binding protein, partial [Tomitella sp.]|nr:AMP-binding protein [Tomitella sp.]